MPDATSNTGIEAGAPVPSEGPWPRMVVFAIALRDPLPLPHSATYSRVLDDEIPELSGMELKVTDDDDLPPLSEHFDGQRIASLRIWQLRRDASHEDFELLQAAMQVLDHVGGSDKESTVPPWQEQEAYRTVVEAVTILRSPDDFVATETRPDALTSCLETLFEMVRAFRLLDQARISELTYERVLPIVPYRWRRVHPPEFFGAPYIMMLSHANVTTPDPGILDPDKMEKHRQLFERLITGDPFLIYAERRQKPESRNLGTASTPRVLFRQQ